LSFIPELVIIIRSYCSFNKEPILLYLQQTLSAARNQDILNTGSKGWTSRGEHLISFVATLTLRIFLGPGMDYGQQKVSPASIIPSPAPYSAMQQSAHSPPGHHYENGAKVDPDLSFETASIR
jgi:hypothetical protein